MNPLGNWLFTSVSSMLVISVGWCLTDRVIEPRLQGTELDGEAVGQTTMEANTAEEGRAMGLVQIVAAHGHRIWQPAGGLSVRGL